MVNDGLVAVETLMTIEHCFWGGSRKKNYSEIIIKNEIIYSFETVCHVFGLINPIMTRNKKEQKNI